MMNKTKVDFIADLLSEKRLNPANKEKIFKLASKELKNLEVTDEGLLKRIEDLEKKINGNTGNNGVSGEPKNKNKEQREKYHDPIKVLNWLQLFTQDNTDIKFSTHLWDDSQRYETFSDFINKINEEWKRFSFYEMVDYNSNLYWEKIYPFLRQDKVTDEQKNKGLEFGWGRQNNQIEIGWQYPDIIKNWCAKNYDGKGSNKKTPFEMEVPDYVLPKRKISGVPIKYFEDIVEVFKKEIEFRNDDLYYRVKNLAKKRLSEFNVDQNSLLSLKGHSFFTNTEYVEKAIDRIFTQISKNTESPQVSIKGALSNDANSFLLEILHKGSFSNKPIDHSKIKLENSSGDLSILRKTLKSLCDYAIESKFRDDSGELASYRINYLYDEVEEHNWHPYFEKMDAEAEGFKHILKFPLQ